MIVRLNQLRLPIEHRPEDIRKVLLEQFRLAERDVSSISIVRRGVDARNAPRIYFVYTIDFDVLPEVADTLKLPLAPSPRHDRLPRRHHRRITRPTVIGSGPCGIFAALTLAQAGYQPLVIERGKPARDRTVDTFRFWRQGVFNAQSNVQFGEGGAGTFSDGKLYSQIRDRERNAEKILRTFVEAGAPEEILFISKPHIGTFRLVTVVESIRRYIESLGGSYMFETQVLELELDGRNLVGLHCNDSRFIRTDHTVLAIGHSARETFQMLHRKGVHTEAKPFSIGVRIEHPQRIIDALRYKGNGTARALLGAADYKLVHHCASGRAVYSFCMCPGGTVVAATSEPGRVVTNGMSQYSRAERNANAGLVVSVSPADYGMRPLAGLDFQRDVEARAYAAGGSSFAAPVQMVGDFLQARPSTSLGTVEPSYKPGVVPTDLASCLPKFVVESLREAIPALNERLPGFAMPDAVMTGVETRTSSPIRITRGQNGQSINTPGLFPAGEGAGYAGGILSAAIDGLRIGRAVIGSIEGTDADQDMRASSGAYGDKLPGDVASTID